jgi:uridine monophosphate synthetase
MKELIKQLLNKNIVEYGDFTLKSGKKSSIYVDLRKLISHPKLLKTVCTEINNKIDDSSNTFNALVGVPTGGYSFTQTCSILANKPCLFLRKDAKDHGKKKLLEGEWKKGDKIVLIEDVITTGTSLLETIHIVQEMGLIIEKIIVVLKRSDEGIKNILNKTNISVEYLFSLEELNIYNDRSLEKKNQNVFAQSFMGIVNHKQTNIIISLDLDKAETILYILEQVAPHICGVKLHLDIIKNVSTEFFSKLKELSMMYNFFIIEDRKFADIGSTVEKQLLNEHYNMKELVDAVTVHSISGPDIINIFRKHNKPILLIQEMSSKDNLFNDEYIQNTTDISKNNEDIILGMIGQHKKNQNLLLFTPGVNIDIKGDNQGQQYKTPKMCLEKGTDIFIIGRSIYNNSKPVEKIIQYKQLCWK